MRSPTARAGCGPSLDVRVAFCEQNFPNLRDVLPTLPKHAVVVPLLLADAYHARVDIPAMIADAGTRRPPGRRARRGRSADPCLAPATRAGRGIAARSRGRRSGHRGGIVTPCGQRPHRSGGTRAHPDDALDAPSRRSPPDPIPVWPRPRICCGAAAPAAWSSRPGSWRTARSSTASRHSLAHSGFRCHHPWVHTARSPRPCSTASIKSSLLASRPEGQPPPSTHSTINSR